jgi:hypothetical protein
LSTAPWTMENFSDRMTDTNGVFVDQLGEALTTWVAMQNGREVSVGHAAVVFNTTPDVILAAVAEAYWLDATGSGALHERILEVDGE